MKIIKITKIKNNEYSLTLDNGEKLKTYDEVILNNKLLTNRGLTSSLLNKLNQESSYYKNYYKALKYAGRKYRSEKEVGDYLEKLEVIKDDRIKIIAELKLKKIVDNIAFAKAYINDKINFTTQGPEKIKSGLIKHNIELDVINKYITSLEYDVIINKLTKEITKKIRSNRSKSSYQLKNSIICDFLSDGYSKDDITKILGLMNIDEGKVISTQYDKVNRKLKRKYSGSELIFQIRNELYKKGFKVSEIDKIIYKKNETN